MLKIKNLTKKFNDKSVLDNISLDVKKGEIALFLGQSGVGKSTLLRVLNNLETADSGHITLDDQPLDAQTIGITHKIGMVFQHFNLFDHLTVQENITLPLEKVMGKSAQDAQETALKLLQYYGLESKSAKYPAQLSGGQKQRLAIARALALQPKVICLDEPTSALDPLLTTHVANTIAQLAQQGYIVLVATHDTALLDKLSCSIYLMAHGAIIEKASSQEFKNNKDQYPKIRDFVAGVVS